MKAELLLTLNFHLALAVDVTLSHIFDDDAVPLVRGLSGHRKQYSVLTALYRRQLWEENDII